MTNQSDLNKDMVALLSSVTDSIHQLQEAVKLIHTEINHLKSSQTSETTTLNRKRKQD